MGSIWFLPYAGKFCHGRSHRWIINLYILFIAVWVNNRKHFDLIQIGQFCTDQGMQVQGMRANLNTANQILHCTIALCS